MRRKAGQGRRSLPCSRHPHLAIPARALKGRFGTFPILRPVPQQQVTPASALASAQPPRSFFPQQVPTGPGRPCFLGRRDAAGAASQSICRGTPDRQAGAQKGIQDQAAWAGRESQRCSIRPRPTTSGFSRDALPSRSSRPTTILLPCSPRPSRRVSLDMHIVRYLLGISRVVSVLKTYRKHCQENGLNSMECGDLVFSRPSFPSGPNGYGQPLQ